MKFALLMTMLAVGGLCGWFEPASLQVTADGTIKCNHPFYSYVMLLELDKQEHDIVATQESILNVEEGVRQNFTKQYKVSGEAWDGWPESAVEPMLMIQHNCGGEGLKCLCKTFPRTESSEKTLSATVNVDLLKPDLPICNDGDCVNHAIMGENYRPSYSDK